MLADDYHRVENAIAESSYSLGQEVIMLEYRVTKYDPAFRDSSGAYTRDEWIGVSDIGRSFGGVFLTLGEYLRIEDAYVAAGLDFLRESGQSALAVKALWNERNHALAFGEGSVLGLEQLEPLIRSVLRGEYWCRLEGPASFLHFGHDYYLYVGVPGPCPQAQKRASRLDLFVEEFSSPYREGAIRVWGGGQAAEAYSGDCCSRGKTVAGLIRELQTFDERLEVRMSLDDGDTFYAISMVGRVDGLCVLMNCEEVPTALHRQPTEDAPG